MKLIMLACVKTDLKHFPSTRNKLWRLRRNQTKTQYEGRWQSEYIYWSRLKHKFWLGEQAVKDVLRSAVRGWLLGESLTKKNGVWQKKSDEMTGGWLDVNLDYILKLLPGCTTSLMILFFIHRNQGLSLGPSTNTRVPETKNRAPNFFVVVVGWLHEATPIEEHPGN